MSERAMRFSNFPPLLILAAASVLSCSGGDGPSGADCFIDEGIFRDLQAGSGTTPVLTWCGAPARTLQVQRASTSADVWRVDCTVESLCIDPRVTYGDSIPNTVIAVSPQPLQAGQAYQFCLAGVDERPPTICVQFTP